MIEVLLISFGLAAIADSTLLLFSISKLPKIHFVTEQFIQVFEKGNQAIYPMQFALILVAIASVKLAANQKPFANKTILETLS